MFRKLRNEFLLINMTIITIVMLFAFTIIYISTHNNTMTDNQQKLARIAPINISGSYVIDENRGFQGIISTDFSLSFNIVFDRDGNIERINSYIEMSEEDYERLGELAFKEKKDYSTIKLGDKEWMYRVVTVGNKITVGRPIAHMQSDSIYIVFLDITESTASLKQLLLTFVFVGILMLFIIFGISLYFANESIRPIKQAWDQQSQFVADASHELKTPLTIIATNTEALLTNKKDSIENQKKWIDYIRNETSRMDKLVNDLLYLAKAEDLNVEISNLPFNISEVVTESLLTMEAISYEKKICLESNIEENLFVYGDVDKFKQVVMILLDNAVKYTNEEGKITVNLVKNNKSVTLFVENTGAGIKAEDLPKIFDRFYRVDKARNSGDNSYGLGLAIAKTVVERMDGKISISSIEGCNTTVKINLKIK